MSLVIYEVKERIAYITLNRPEKKNALNHELIGLLKTAFRNAASDSTAKVVVLKAAGDNFCAGADLEYIQSLQKNTYEENLQDSRHLMELFSIIYKLNKTVIAQINGPAIAGGCGLVSVCDFSFSVPEARFGYSEVKIGFLPAIVMAFLIKKTGEAKARELLLSGNFITATEAQRDGLIQYIAKTEDLEMAVSDFAQKLCRSNSGTSMELIKKMFAEISTLTIDEALEFGARMNAEARNSVDCRKGIDYFLNKKKLEW
jgi:methylglutaconyl-CoA hydratase